MATALTKQGSGWLAADLLSQYFGAKLTEFSQANNTSSKRDSSEEGEEESDAMDVSRSPRPAVTVMGEAWVQRLRQLLMYVQQLGLEVSSPDIGGLPPGCSWLLTPIVMTADCMHTVPSAVHNMSARTK